MENVRQLFSYEEGCISSFQARAHFGNTDREGQNDEVFSHLCKRFGRCSWSTQAEIVIQSTSQGGGIDQRFIYDVNSAVGVDYIIASDLWAELPEIRLTKEAVDEGVEIAWMPLIFHRIIRTGEFKIEDNTAAQFDGPWLSVRREICWDGRENAGNFYDYMVGSRPELIEWNTHLPSAEIICPQPWSYELRPMPLFNKNGPIKLSHEYELRLKIQDLLIMRKTNNNDEKMPIKFKMEYLMPTDVSLVPPKMIIKVAAVSEEERNASLEFLPSTIWYDDVVHQTYELNSNSTDHQIDLIFTGPVKALFWYVGEIGKDKFADWSTIEKVQISFGVTKKRGAALPSIYYTHMEAWRHGINLPKAKIGSRYFCHGTLNEKDGDVGVNMDNKSNYKLILRLDHSMFEETVRYNLHLFAVIQREIWFSEKIAHIE